MRNQQDKKPHTSFLISRFSYRVPLAWLLLSAIVAAAAVILWKVAILDAPPGGSAFVLSSSLKGALTQANGPSATITPFGGVATALPPAVVSPEGVVRTVASPTLAAALTPIISASSATDLPGPPTSIPPSPTTAMIVVYVSGDVTKPGLYSLPEGSRVDAAVAAAGGPLPDADLEQINLAQLLSDQDHVSVDRQGELAPTPTTLKASSRPSSTPRGTRTASTSTGAQPATTPPVPSGPKPTPSIKINLNTASVEQLELVPGIGPAIAQRIIADRQQNGPYKSIEDLTRISGIKEGIVARIRDYVTVGP